MRIGHFLTPRAYTFSNLTVKFFRSFKLNTCSQGYVEFFVGEIGYRLSLSQFSKIFGFDSSGTHSILKSYNEQLA